MDTRTQPESHASNLLVDALPSESRDALLGKMSELDVKVGTVIFRQGQPIEQVYFPLTGVLSLITTLRDGSTIEYSTLGNEGTTGVPVFLGATAWLNGTCISQVPGRALMMPASDFRDAIDHHPRLRDVVGRYTQTLLVQVGQAVACNSLHPTVQRCARWLLTTQDRVNDNEFPLTQEFLAYMLGVRRASVTVAAGKLQSAGLITYKRGHITVTDRDGLEQAACECYDVIRVALEDLFALRVRETEVRSHES